MGGCIYTIAETESFLIKVHVHLDSSSYFSFRFLLQQKGDEKKDLDFEELYDNILLRDENMSIGDQLSKEIEEEIMMYHVSKQELREKATLQIELDKAMKKIEELEKSEKKNKEMINKFKTMIDSVVDY